MSRTLNTAFSDFLSLISPSQSERSKASRSQTYIRQILSNKNDSDPIFPRIERDFLIGSYVRHTKINPLDDIDVFEVMDGSGLCLLEKGQIVLSDIEGSGGIPNPLLVYCDEDSLLNSVKVLNTFRSSLQATYSDSEVGRDGQAVTVNLPSLGFTIDVVPAVHITPLFQSPDRYFIPEGHGSRGWKATNPDMDRGRVEEANRIHANLASHIIKMMKYWNKRRNRSRLRSYHVEVMCLSLLGNQPISSYEEGLNRVFSKAPGFVANYCLDPKNLEGFIDLYLDDEKRRHTIEALGQYQRHAASADIFSKLGMQEDAIKACCAIFGELFPEYTPAFV